MTKYNLNGWNFVEWIKGNYQNINWKDVLKICLPLITLLVTTGDFWTTAIGTIISKFILDVIHYYINE